MAAKNILQVAERVETALDEAESIQKKIDDGILITNQNIVDANNSITNVSNFISIIKMCKCHHWYSIHFVL